MSIHNNRIKEENSKPKCWPQNNEKMVVGNIKMVKGYIVSVFAADGTINRT